MRTAVSCCPRFSFNGRMLSCLLLLFFLSFFFGEVSSDLDKDLYYLSSPDDLFVDIGNLSPSDSCKADNPCGSLSTALGLALNYSTIYICPGQYEAVGIIKNYTLNDHIKIVGLTDPFNSNAVSNITADVCTSTTGRVG